MARTEGELRHGGEQGTIGVQVTLFADPRRFFRPVDGPHRRTVPAGSTVAELPAVIGVPEDADITIGVNGELAGSRDRRRDGADVMPLSLMEGGAAPPNATYTARPARTSGGRERQSAPRANLLGVGERRSPPTSGDATNRFGFWNKILHVNLSPTGRRGSRSRATPSTGAMGAGGDHRPLPPEIRARPAPTRSARTTS
jgi:hypothetical protein